MRLSTAKHLANNPHNDRRQPTSRNGKHYNHLNKKLDHLLQRKPHNPATKKQEEKRHQFYERVKNLTEVKLNQEEKNLLNYGMNYSIEKPPKAYIATLAAETELAIRLLDAKLQSTYRHLATKKLKQIISPNNQANIRQKRQLCIMEELNKKLNKENAIITQADKGKTMAIINSEDCAQKVHQFLTDNNFSTITKDPTNKYQKLIQKTCKACSKIYVGRTSRNRRARHNEHTRYIKNNDPRSAYTLHILNNRHEYGNIEDTMTLLKGIDKQTLQLPTEQLYIQTLHNSKELISELIPNEPNPLFELIQIAHLTSQPRNELITRPEESY
jgi:hypothetical protein